MRFQCIDLVRCRHTKMLSFILPFLAQYHINITKLYLQEAELTVSKMSYLKVKKKKTENLYATVSFIVPEKKICRQKGD